MLTSLFQAIVGRLASPELPVFLTDCVPEGAAFPYITAEIIAPLLPDREGSLTLTVWCRSDASNRDRILLTDRLFSRLPARGVRLALDNGTAILQLREGTACVHSRDALGVRTFWMLRCFPGV